MSIASLVRPAIAAATAPGSAPCTNARSPGRSRSGRAIVNVSARRPSNKRWTACWARSSSRRSASSMDCSLSMSSASAWALRPNPRKRFDDRASVTRARSRSSVASACAALITSSASSWRPRPSSVSPSSRPHFAVGLVIHAARARRSASLRSNAKIACCAPSTRSSGLPPPPLSSRQMATRNVSSRRRAS